MVLIFRYAFTVNHDFGLAAPAGVLAFARGPGFACLVNLSAAPVALPPHDAVLLLSGQLHAGRLPPDTAAWLRL